VPESFVEDDDDNDNELDEDDKEDEELPIEMAVLFNGLTSISSLSVNTLDYSEVEFPMEMGGFLSSSIASLLALIVGLCFRANAAPIACESVICSIMSAPSFPLLLSVPSCHVFILTLF
jgi:hypothetical protein